MGGWAVKHLMMDCLFRLKAKKIKKLAEREKRKTKTEAAKERLKHALKASKA